MSHSKEDFGLAAYMILGPLVDALEKRFPGVTKEIYADARANAESQIAAGNDPNGNLAIYLKIIEPHG